MLRILQNSTSLYIFHIIFKAGKIILPAFFIFSLSNCALFDRPEDPKEQVLKKAIKQKIFYTSYENVWRALHQVIRYPITAENQDTGIIETEFIKAVDGFQTPEMKKSPSPGLRYKLIFTVARGKQNNRDATRVTIDKKIEILRDFFSEPEIIPSDGLEEKVIFYRIDRELAISESIRRMNEGVAL
ncbi:MAG: hypothetical protein ACK5P5_01740 [Pseudobdellovibrionaceae bacterium]